MSVGGEVDGSSSLWDGTSRGSCGGGGSGCGVCGGTISWLWSGTVVVGGGATGQPFSHLNPVYTNPGSGPYISRNRQCIKKVNRFIGLFLGYKFRIFRVKKLAANPESFKCSRIILLTPIIVFNFWQIFSLASSRSGIAKRFRQSQIYFKYSFAIKVLIKERLLRILLFGPYRSHFLSRKSLISS